MHIWVYACVHTYTHTYIHLTSLCRPPVRSGAPVPLRFSALWYHAGQIFLSAWMTPWHGVYLDWQLVFIWIDMQRRGKKRLTEEGSGHQDWAPICPGMKNMLTMMTMNREGQRKVHHHLRLKIKKEPFLRLMMKISSYIDIAFIICLQRVTKTQMSLPLHQDEFFFFLLCLFVLASFCIWTEWTVQRSCFLENRLPASTAKGRLIKCHQSEMRVKWRGKSWIFTLIWLTPGGLQSLMTALICIVLCAPHPFTLTINSFNTFALI